MSWSNRYAHIRAQAKAAWLASVPSRVPAGMVVGKGVTARTSLAARAPFRAIRMLPSWWWLAIIQSIASGPEPWNWPAP
jgi:hypothetical protein